MTRSRVVISTFGSLGDLNPYVAIALELRHRGYQPVIATTPLYRDKITSLGLWFHPVRPDLPSYDRPEDLEAMVRGAMDPMTGIRSIVGELIMPYLRGIYDDLCQAVQGAALLLSHPLPLVAPIVAERTDVPWVSSVLAPMSLFSVHDPAVNAQLPWLRPFLKLSPALSRASIHLVKRLSNRMLRPLYVLRAELGLPPGPHPLIEGLHAPSAALALFSKLLVRDQRDWPRQLRVTGFPYHDLRGRLGDPVDLPLGLRRFLEAGPPPLVFSLGSAAFWVAGDFFKQSIEAAVALGQRAVLLVGDDRFLPRDPVPVGIEAYDYAPYGALFPHASVVIHHGGIGSIAQGLRAGRPMLVVPIAHDQYDNAARVGALGVARTLPRRRYQKQQVVSALRALLQEPSYAERARAVAAEVRHEQGAAAAVDIIEEVLARGGRPNTPMRDVEEIGIPIH